MVNPLAFSPASMLGLYHFILVWSILIALFLLLAAIAACFCYGGIKNIAAFPGERSQAIERGNRKAAQSMLEIDATTRNIGMDDLKNYRKNV